MREPLRSGGFAPLISPSRLSNTTGRRALVSDGDVGLASFFSAKAMSRLISMATDSRKGKAGNAWENDGHLYWILRTYRPTLKMKCEVLTF